MSNANGIEWARKRIASLPDHLRSQLEKTPPGMPPDLHSSGLVATGVGSSEAAARYLVALCQRIGIPATFQPLSYFYGTIHLPSARKPYLALFSQGLSPNSGIVLKQRHHFAGTLLFTSSTPEGQRAAGKSDRAALLEDLQAEGAAIILHPMQNEYEILPRFVGPLCVMFSVCLLLEAWYPGSLGGKEILRTLPDTLEDLELSSPSDWLADLQPGLHFWFSHAGSQYAQNLSCKLLETLFIPPPPIGDALTYSHGPFQLNCKDSTPNWIFSSSDPLEQDLLTKLLPLYQKTGPVKIITSPLPQPLSIFYYETFLNLLMLKALEYADVDLFNWPGKGQDDEGYRLNAPGLSPKVSKGNVL